VIGPEWAGAEEQRARPSADAPRQIAVVTGPRAGGGLLRPVMHAIQDRQDLQLLCIAAGSHMIQPALTFRDVRKAFDIADSVPMQVAGTSGRGADVQALGRGVARFGRSFERIKPDWVVVLGDRIEAFAAASAASVGGIALAHIHGGDRAEGVADEAMRHAITKLAHLHLPATRTSAERVLRMGEDPNFVVCVGSPALDGLDAIEPMGDEAFSELGSPEVVFLMHPIGRTSESERATAGRGARLSLLSSPRARRRQRLSEITSEVHFSRSSSREASARAPPLLGPASAAGTPPTSREEDLSSPSSRRLAAGAETALVRQHKN